MRSRTGLCRLGTATCTCAVETGLCRLGTFTSKKISALMQVSLYLYVPLPFSTPNSSAVSSHLESGSKQKWKGNNWSSVLRFFPPPPSFLCFILLIYASHILHELLSSQQPLKHANGLMTCSVWCWSCLRLSRKHRNRRLLRNNY